jgi:4'-phosphopantetheinyl transferase EntD
VAAVIEEILPASVAAEEAFDDPPGVALFPEEEAVLARAVDKLRREFTTVRLCARRALGRLGAAPVPLVPGRRGAPQWPPGLVGSMTHCAGYRAAAVARAGDLRAVGIDAEPDQPLPAGVLEAVARPEEQARLRDLAARAPRASGPEVSADRLLFSAKESVFKAWYPLTGRELGFDEATLMFDPERRTFCARLLVAEPPVVDGHALTELSGRWTAGGGLLVTAVVVAAGP